MAKALIEDIDIDKLIDFVSAHGFGKPTKKGLKIGLELFDGDYAGVAADIVFLRLTTEPENK